VSGARILPVLCLAALALDACTGPPLELGPAALPNAVEDSSYAAALSADADIAHWTVVSGALPAGLNLGDETGTLSGRPSAAGDFEFVIAAEARAVPRRRGEQTYALHVIPRLRLDFAPSAARVGEPYEYTPAISGGEPPYAVSLVGLPAGMDYDRTTGRIFGTPQFEEFSLPLAIRVQDAGDPQQSVQDVATLAIHPEPVTITTATLPAATVGQAYSATVGGEGGRRPYRWAIVAGVLPDGLRLNLLTGVISGTPTTAGVATFTVRITDFDVPASVAEQEFTIDVRS
jgi:hypothetical protein